MYYVLAYKSFDISIEKYIYLDIRKKNQSPPLFNYNVGVYIFYVHKSLGYDDPVRKSLKTIILLPVPMNDNRKDAIE